MQPDIETNRLILRPFRLSDGDRVAQLAGEKAIADMTANIPHPYKPEMAVDWIKTHEAQFVTRKGIIYAITLKGDDDIIGTVSLLKLEHGLGVLGYWLGVPYWGQGITLEASQGLIHYCRMHLGLKQLQVMHLVGNERSQSVIKKLGIPYKGNITLRMQGAEREVCLYQLIL
ncbi:GNAT family N-acetyltransferase [Motilimonas cestriensis]|uniref:GNAT family N-acetyltransferase n=1 Tax=Motilimonas cestriensis TaxID=2742685 RepID=UPI003DA54E97